MFLQLAVAALALLGPYLYAKLRYKRFKQFAIFPQMPPSLLWGHLQKLDVFIKAGPPNGHPDLAFVAMHEALGRPPIVFADMRPFMRPMIVVRSHEVAEQVAKAYPDKLLPYGMPKMPEIYGHMIHLTGPKSVLNVHGEEWKTLRKRFNTGFAHQHLITFLPVILEKAAMFIGHVEKFAQTGQDFSFGFHSANLTFDIICSVVMNSDFGAQSLDSPSEFIRVYHDLFETYAEEQMDLPWFFTPLTEWKRIRLSKRIRNILRGVVRNEFDRRQIETVKSRSVLSLSLQDVNTLTPEVIGEACDQLNTFLFAGHDTTSVLLSWLFYELSRTPRALKAVRDELDDVFGADPSPSAVREKLLSNGGKDLVSRMTYTNAAIKEALRLWPPAATARVTGTEGSGITIKTPAGDVYPLDGVYVYNCQILIQRDPEVFGETANEFVPERWLGEAGEKIPPSAFRAFERGPRNCIGQELATIEARVVVALLARRYDFVKVGTGELSLDEAGMPILNANGQYKVVSEMYSVSP
ncbi:cytochrome P450 [Podospora didyma]|uniref:Cytochrome P450 n=1 Tax=Podospora didyma TaxID=330526 RepID=A0AAE0KET0_9PEZI|nr:cytochrome P450 [Podospora didyma]